MKSTKTKNKEKNNNQTSWWTYSETQISEFLETNSKQGLSNDQIKQREKKYGYNKLPTKKSTSVFFLFLNQFSSIIVWTLIITLFITAWLGQWADSISIGSIVILNAFLGFIQEYRAQKSLAALKKLTIPHATVLRNGEIRSINAYNLVPGDIVFLAAGDIVPADGRIIYTASLKTQEAVLTGESEPIIKTSNILKDRTLELSDQKNMVFMGTIVTYGKGTIIVTSIGINTELGQIATLLKEKKDLITPLQKQLNTLGYQLILISFAIVILIFIIGIFRHMNFYTMVLTALSLAIAAIPEGIPAIMTITMALGVRRMAERHAIIKKLSCIETLGCTNVICTDKTGTLTQNKLIVRTIWTMNNIFTVTGDNYIPKGKFLLQDIPIDPNQYSDLSQILTIAALCNTAHIQKNDQWKLIGDPTEGAILVAAYKADYTPQKLSQKKDFLGEVPFDTDRKLMSVAYQTSHQKNLLYTKGAPDIVLARSKSYLNNDNVEPLTQESRATILKVIEKLAHEGLRLLGVAYKEIHSAATIDTSNEYDLIFVGLLGMQDVPRREAVKAIAECRKAGIMPIMITGDYLNTAQAIAKEIGLINDESLTITGKDLDALSDEELQNKVNDIVIYARTSAKDKLRIVNAWQARGAIVTMTGDGVNDAPAIQQADIGIAMGISGTEATKEAADIVITDDNFASIITAIHEGRGIYQNIKTIIAYLLSSNLAELMIIFISITFGFTDQLGNYFIPLLPIHLLWINLITDGFPALALALEPASSDIMTKKPRNTHEPLLNFHDFVNFFFIGLIISTATLTCCYYGLSISTAKGHTMAFTSLIILEFLRVYMIQTKAFHLLIKNKLLIGAFCISFILQLAIIYIPYTQKLFHTVPLSFFDWSIIMIIVIMATIISIPIQKFMKST